MGYGLNGIRTFSVYRQHEKPWVAELMVPYLVFFGVASVVSSFTFVQKCKLVVDKFRRQRADSNDAAEVQVETLEEKLDAKTNGDSEDLLRVAPRGH